MPEVSPPIPPSSAVTAPGQKRRLIMGLAVWVAGGVLSLSMIPVVNASDLATGLKATLNSILLLGVPKLFLLAAIAIMGKPGFAYLRSLIGAHIHRFTRPLIISPLRYRIGLTLFVIVNVVGSLAPYIAHDAFTLREEHPRVLAAIGDLLLLVSLILLGGDFWDKLRALFSREAKVVFPSE